MTRVSGLTYFNALRTVILKYTFTYRILYVLRFPEALPLVGEDAFEVIFATLFDCCFELIYKVILRNEFGRFYREFSGSHSVESSLG